MRSKDKRVSNLKLTKLCMKMRKKWKRILRSGNKPYFLNTTSQHMMNFWKTGIIRHSISTQKLTKEVRGQTTRRIKNNTNSHFLVSSISIRSKDSDSKSSKDKDKRVKTHSNTNQSSLPFSHMLLTDGKYWITIMKS